MKKFTITTLGCRVNQSESAAMTQSLQARGFSRAEAGNDTDSAEVEVCIINTCTVTQKASMQSRQAIRRAMRHHPEARIIVTGCYAQTDPEAVRKVSANCEVIGHLQKSPLRRVIDAAAGHDLDRPSAPLNETIPLAVDGTRSRPVIKVQDGCDAFCTYCIVPHARGRSRSVPMNQVLEQIDMLAAAGFHEAVLSGIHLGCYGRDFDPPGDLHGLIDRIVKQRHIDRIRLSSIEPLELTDGIIDLAAATKRICSHFHIPMQSGDNKILKRMGRPYSAPLFKELVLKLKHKMPDAAIGVDILIGFPGETERAFENTYKLIESLPVTYLHVFPFSARPKTAAATFEPKVAPEIIKQRTKRMRKLGFSKKRKFYYSLVGKDLEVLIETKRDRKTGLLKGISSNYVPVLLDGDDSLKNSIVTCKIVSTGEELIVKGVAAP